jgi:hypothetical protein
LLVVFGKLTKNMWNVWLPLEGGLNGTFSTQKS